MANYFNSFFANFTSKVKGSVSHSNHTKLKYFCNPRLSDNVKFNINIIEKDKIKKNIFQQWTHAQQLILMILDIDY